MTRPPTVPRRPCADDAVADFFEVDTRWLAVGRIAAGLLLVVYAGFLASHDRPRAFFSDEGMWPRAANAAIFPAHHAASLMRYVGTVEGAEAAIFGLAVLGALLAVGFGTRVVAPLAVVWIAQLHLRVVPVVNASMVTMHLVAIPFCLLPMGRHLSVDAWFARRVGRAGAAARVRTLAPLVLRLQLAFIYLFNAVQKDGETWRSGDAVHYVLYSSHATWPYVAALRSHEPTWFSPVATYGALALEGLLTLALVFPCARTRLRRAAVVGMVLLHGGICLMVDLGPFPFVFGLAALLLLASEPWPAAPRAAPVEPPTGLAWAREGFLAAHLLVAVAQLWPGNAAVRFLLGPAPSLAWAEPYTQRLFLAQAWSMFAPEAPRRDLIWVPVVVTRDGRLIDAAHGGRPDFRGLDRRAAPVDAFLQIAETHLLGHPIGLVGAPVLTYYVEHAVRRGYVERRELARAELHVLECDRPARRQREPAVRYSRVAFEQVLAPTPGPVVPGP